MSKGYEYNSKSRVTAKRATKAKVLITLIRGVVYLIPVAGVVALIMFTPPYFWGPLLGMLTVFGLIIFLVFKGEDIGDWYSRLKNDLEYAKQYGVADE